MGVDVIEAGFPISSQGDFRAVSEISRIVKRASVCGLSRAGFKDIDRAGEALKGAFRPRIHTFISTSPVHMKHKLNMGENAVLEAVGASVTRARNYTGEVEWSAEDATRTVPDFLCRCVDVAIQSGATVINVPDTVGYSTPQEFFDIITMLREPRPQCRQGDLLHPLPQRSGPGGGQFAGRRIGRRAAGGMRHQLASASAPATRRWKKS